jgi:transposase
VSSLPLLIVSGVSDGGQLPRAVAREFRVTERTVRKWLRRFRAEGAAGLTDRSCRPNHIPHRYLQPGDELHDAVFALLHTPPADHGFNRTSWKLSDLGQVLRTQGKQATQRNIGAVIKAAGYRWKQARVTLTSSDPNYRDKLNRIRSTLSGLASDEAFFASISRGMRHPGTDRRPCLLASRR